MQTPEEVHTFVTSCAERLPLLHLILRNSLEKPIQKVLQFLNNIPDLYKVSSNVSADGRKAGQYYKKQAQAILCEGVKSDNNLRTVLALINADTSLDDPESAFSPLMLAAQHDSTEVMKALIKSGASVDRWNSTNETSLFIACQHKQWDAARLLYDNGANAFITNKDDKSVFTVAKEEHGVALLQYMAEKDDDIRQRLMDSISLSDVCQYGYDLVAKQYDTDSVSAEEIMGAVTKSCVSRNTIILEHFAPKVDDHSLSRQITQAYESGHHDCVDALLKPCAGRQNMPCPDISLAETCKNIDFTDLTYFLIEKGKDVNKDHGEPLRNAAEHGNISAVKYLIQFGAKVDKVDRNGVSSLLLACKRNHLHIVEILLNYTANINIKTDQKETPLMESCQNGNLQLVNRLLSNNPSPLLNDKNKDGKTALEVAIDNHHATIVMALIKKGAQLPLQQTSHRDAQFLQKLCSVGDVCLVSRYLGDENKVENKTEGDENEVENKTEGDKDKVENKTEGDENKANNKTEDDQKKGGSLWNRFKRILHKKKKKRIEIKEEKMDINEERMDIKKERMVITTKRMAINEQLLSVVIRADNIPLLQYLLTSDKIDTGKKTLVSALTCACMAGSFDIVRMIIQLFNNDKTWQTVQKENRSHLYPAIHYENAPLVSFLLSSGCVPGKDCPVSASFRSKDILCLLLQYDIPVARRNTALMTVCKGGHHTAEFCARQLLDKSADANYRDMEDPDQLTVLMAAMLKQSVRLVTLLLERGANPNITDNKGRSPLFVACDLGHHELASLLLYNSGKGGPAYPNLRVEHVEKHPLWTACMRDHLDLVLLLMNVKADPDLSDQEGCHLVQKAHKDGHSEVVRLLLEGGVDPSILIYVNLQESCHLGYSEYVQSIYQGVSFEELKMGIREACKSGYPEIAMDIIIDMTDESNQKECYDVWKHIWQGLPSTRSVNKVVAQLREDDPLWQCFCKNDHEQMEQLLRDGHNPNTTNGRGTPLLHACMQNKMKEAVFALCNSPKININQKDELGRTVLFYTLDWFMVTHNGQKCCMFDYILQHGAEVLPDDFGRTLLHAWQTVPSGGIQGVTLEQLTKHVDIDQADYKGQTALHIAVLQNNPGKVKELLDIVSNPQVLDVNKISPFSLAKQHQESTICDMLSETCLVEGNLSGVVHHNISEPENVHFSNDYKMEHRVTGALNKLFHQSNQTPSSNKFMEKYKLPMMISEKASFLSEFKLFRSTVLSFMRDIGSAISREDSLFEFKPVLSGSCSEGTKVSEMNEADVLCWFQHPDWEHIDLATHESNNYAYMKMECRRLAEKRPALFKNNHLSVYGIFQRFYALVRKNIAQVLSRYDSLYLLDGSKILHSDHAICALQLVWSGKLFTWQPFSLDVVPAIPVSVKKLPGKLNHHDLIHDLYIVPKWTASLSETEYSDLAFQLGLSYTEKDFFYAMPDHLRQGYKLTKVALHDCMAIDDVPANVFLSSYMLKCGTFECFSDMPDFQVKLKGSTARNLFDGALGPPQQVIEWADKILAKLENHITKQRFESFFLPGSDLIGHSQYKNDHRPLLYARLCRAMLHSPSENIAPWAKLAHSVADQLCRPGNVLREAFVTEIQLLREMGLDRNYRWENGCNLLFFMIKYDLEIGVQNLLEWGTSVKNVDGRGTSALDLTTAMNIQAIENLLVEVFRGKHSR